MFAILTPTPTAGSSPLASFDAYLTPLAATPGSTPPTPPANIDAATDQVSLGSQSAMFGQDAPARYGLRPAQQGTAVPYDWWLSIPVASLAEIVEQVSDIYAVFHMAMELRIRIGGGKGATRSDMSEDGDSQGAYWDSVTTYRPAADRIESAVRWHTPELDLHGCYLREIPAQVWTMTHLTELHLYLNQLTTLPEAVGDLTELSWLSIAGNELDTLPDSIGRLTGLTRLDGQDNRLTALPDSIGNLRNLTTLYLHGNQLTEVPASLARLSALTTLFLSGNHIRELPAWLGTMPRLTSLRVTGNPLSRVPPQLAERFDIEWTGSQ